MTPIDRAVLIANAEGFGEGREVKTGRVWGSLYEKKSGWENKLRICFPHSKRHTYHAVICRLAIHASLIKYV